MSLFKDVPVKDIPVEMDEAVKKVETELYPGFKRGELTKDEFTELCQDALDIKKIEEAAGSIILRGRIEKAITILMKIASAAAP